MTLALVAVVLARFALFHRPANDLGSVSAQWLTEHRADHDHDPLD
jgi:hypothetical protein